MIATSIFPLAVIIFEAVFYYIDQANNTTYVILITYFHRDKFRKNLSK